MPSKKAGKIRATSQDMMNDISREIADQQLHFVIRCKGRLDAERLRKAVDLCIAARPILGCLLVETGRGPHWRYQDRAPGWGYSEAGGPDLESDLDDFMLLPGDPRKDPLAQVRLFRGERDTVCLRMDHVCADAAGTRNYGYLLVHTYNALAKDPGFRPVVDRRDRGMGAVLRRYGLAKRVGYARAAMRFMRRANKSPGRSWQFPAVSSSRDGRTMAVRHLTAEQMRQTVEMAKRHDATLNDVLLAAYFRALFKAIPVEGKDPVPLQVSADLRRYNPETADLIANLSSAIFAAIPPAGDEPFEQTLEKVRSVMDRMKTSSPLIGAYAIGIPFKLMSYRRAREVISQMTEGRAKRGVAMPLLSNFGKLDPERLSFDGVRPSDAYITTPVMFPPYLMLGASGYEGGLTLTSGYCREGAGDGVERMLDLVLAELPGEIIRKA